MFDKILVYDTIFYMFYIYIFFILLQNISYVKETSVCELQPTILKQCFSFLFFRYANEHSK